MESDDCVHESWECNYGWHTCNDCKVHLGSRQLVYEDHMADDCDICGPHVEHESNGDTIACVLPHPCPNKSYAHKVSVKNPPRPRVTPKKVDVCSHPSGVICDNCAFPSSSCIHKFQGVCPECTTFVKERLARTRGFITKDSGQRAEFDSGMVRDTNEGKSRHDLLYPLGVPYSEQFMTRVADLLARGSVKYEERNWEKASGQEEMDRFKESAHRHFIQWLTGEADEDHAAAVVFGLLGYETTKWKLENEDPTR